MGQPLWEIVATADMSLKELEDFTHQAETVAGLNLATDSWDKFATEKRGVEECEFCALAFGILALSACVLVEPFPS